MPKLTAKLCRVRRNYGYALIPKVVRYFRRHDGTAMHDVIWAHPTIRDYQKSDETVLRKFWLALSLELIRLKTTGRIGASDVDRICGVFEKEFPRVGLVSRAEAKPDRTRKELIAKFPFLRGVREGA